MRASEIVAVVLAACMSVAAAQVPSGSQVLHPDAERAWIWARSTVQRAQDDLVKREAEEKELRGVADSADEALLGERNPAKLQELAKEALERRGQLLDARDRSRQAEKDFEAARAQLRKVASDITRCARPEGESCQARRFWASRQQEPASPTASSYDWVAIAKIVEKGLAAPKQANEIRARVPKGFESGDGALLFAAKAASAAATSPSAPRVIGEDEFEPIRNARNAYEGSFEIYRKAQSVLDMANAMARQSIALAACIRDRPKECPAADGDLLKMARDRQAALDELDKLTKQSLERVENASDLADIGATYTQLEDRQRVAMIRQVLAKNKDAASLFGGEAFRLAANKDTTTATIRIDLDRDVNDPLKDTSLTFSSNVAGDRTRLYGVAEGFGGAFNATFAKTWFLPRPGRDKSVLPDVFALGLSASMGHDEYTFRNPNNLADKTETQARRMPWSVGFKLASVSKDATRWHAFGVNLGRAYEAAGDSTRCEPAPASGSASLACTVGVFGPPTQTPKRLFTYENRFVGKDSVPMALIVKYEDVKGRKEIEVPIYLIKGGEKNESLTGGINLNWRSRDRGSDKPSQTSFGVFVGGPFSLFGSASP